MNHSNENGNNDNSNDSIGNEFSKSSTDFKKNENSNISSEWFERIDSTQGLKESLFTDLFSNVLDFSVFSLLKSRIFNRFGQKPKARKLYSVDSDADSIFSDNKKTGTRTSISSSFNEPLGREERKMKMVLQQIAKLEKKERKKKRKELRDAARRDEKLDDDEMDDDGDFEDFEEFKKVEKIKKIKPDDDKIKRIKVDEEKKEKIKSADPIIPLKRKVGRPSKAYLAQLELMNKKEANVANSESESNDSISYIEQKKLNSVSGSKSGIQSPRRGPKKNFERRDGHGRTPLHLFSSKGDFEGVKEVLKNVITMDVQDNAGYTPLHAAALKGRLKIVKILIKHGANPNSKATNLDTPLHDASENGHLEVVSYLLEHGADPLVLNERQLTAWECTEDKFIRKQLKKFGGKPGSNNKSGDSNDRSKEKRVEIKEEKNVKRRKNRRVINIDESNDEVSVEVNETNMFSAYKQQSNKNKSVGKVSRSENSISKSLFSSSELSYSGYSSDDKEMKNSFNSNSKTIEKIGHSSTDSNKSLKPIPYEDLNVEMLDSGSITKKAKRETLTEEPNLPRRKRVRNSFASLGFGNQGYVNLEKDRPNYTTEVSNFNEGSHSITSISLPVSPLFKSVPMFNDQTDKKVEEKHSKSNHSVKSSSPVDISSKKQHLNSQISVKNDTETKPNAPLRLPPKFAFKAWKMQE